MMEMMAKRARDVFGAADRTMRRIEEIDKGMCSSVQHRNYLISDSPLISSGFGSSSSSSAVGAMSHRAPPSRSWMELFFAPIILMPSTIIKEGITVDKVLIKKAYKYIGISKKIATFFEP